MARLYINISKFKEKILSNYDGNVTSYAKDYRLDRTNLSKALNHPNTPLGATIISNIYEYCENNDLDFQKFVYLKGE